jgi:hypothetical protein
VVYYYAWWYDEPKNINSARLYTQNDYCEFDNINDVDEYITFIKKLNSDVKHPEKTEEYWEDTRTGKKYITKPDTTKHNICSSFLKFHESEWVSNGYDQFYWGCIVLDYKECKIIQSVGERHPDFTKNFKNDLKLKDTFFRKPNEIPNDYKWDNGEYEGWLQYRWGNGLNAIEKEDEINRQKKIDADHKREEKKKQLEEFNKEFKENIF